MEEKNRVEERAAEIAAGTLQEKAAVTKAASAFLARRAAAEGQSRVGILREAEPGLLPRHDPVLSRAPPDLVRRFPMSMSKFTISQHYMGLR